MFFNQGSVKTQCGCEFWTSFLKVLIYFFGYLKKFKNNYKPQNPT